MRIFLFTGGSSSERSVAIASGTQVLAALRAQGHDVSVVDTVTGIVDAEGERQLLSEIVQPAPTDLQSLIAAERQVILGGLLTDPAVVDADCVFLALHGGSGEDGTLQHMLDVADISYTGAGALASALAMDKDLAKRLFKASGISVANWLMVSPSKGIGENLSAEQVGKELGWPVVVKPSKQGSTVGLSVVQEGANLDVAIKEALLHDDEVMVEAFIPGRELTVGILDGIALAVGEIIPPGELFDYESKYTPGRTQEIFPADLPATTAGEVQRLGLLAHEALKIAGYSRVDFRLTPDNQLVCLEVNTLPGLTAASLLPKSAQAVGISFEELCERILSAATE